MAKAGNILKGAGRAYIKTVKAPSTSNIAQDEEEAPSWKRKASSMRNTLARGK